MIEDGAVDRGSVTTVRRVGDTIHRPVGPWTPAVHALLNHLKAVGFARAPRVLGIEGDHEVLSLLHGETAMRPWPGHLRDLAGIGALGTWLREFHDAVAGFRPPPGSRWRDGDVEWEPGMIVRHGDLGPWNSIWAGDRLAGFIDWDFAVPGRAIDDLAQLAWYAVPLRRAERTREAGLDGEHAQPARLEALCAAYGASPEAVLDALEEFQAAEAGRIEEFGGLGREPWATFLVRGDAAEMRGERDWLRSRRAALLGRQ